MNSPVGFCQLLLKQNIVSLSRVQVVGEETLTLEHTLVFENDQSQEFELLEVESSVVCSEILHQDYQVAFPLEFDETIQLEKISSVDQPFVIEGVEEIWASSLKSPYLVGLVFWTKDKNPALALSTGFDDITLVTYEKLQKLCQDDLFALNQLTHYFYS